MVTPVDEELEIILDQLDLRYVSTDMPGIQRKPWGRGFTYIDRKGNTITDSKMRDWIESIVIPPAWEDVWISPYKNGHILATGRDDRGRKQYRYHPCWVEMRNENKFGELERFGESLPHLREVVDSHMRKHTLTREKVLAIVVRLLETTMIRIGNVEYTRDNETYGLTTLQDDHVEVNTNSVTFEFTGKSGKDHTIALKDPRLARAVKACQDIPGQELFQYYDENHQRHCIGSSDVNAYLKEITGEDFTAKIFRTWGASVAAVEWLCEQPPGETESAREAQVRECIKTVAGKLGNTTTVCRKYYLHPTIVNAFMNSEFDCTHLKEQAKAESDYTLSKYEALLINLIRG